MGKRKNFALYKKVLNSDKDFNNWYEDLAIRSKMTANESARVLVRYLKDRHMTPSELVKKAKNNPKDVTDELDKYVKKRTKEGRKALYLKSYVKVIRSYLNFHSITLVRKIRFSKDNWEPTDDHTPTQDELRKLLMASPLRTQAIEISMAHMGVRPQVLGTSDGTNGLRLKHILDLEVKDNKVNFKNIPALVRVPMELSKNDFPYHTFLSREGCEILKNYLESRVIETGEQLNGESPLITISKAGYDKMGKNKANSNYGSTFIETQSISREVRRAWRKISDKPPRPYVLRSYFDTRLMLGETEGKISHVYRMHFMGHKGDIETTYTLAKKQIPADVIQQMRESYIRCEPYLSTEKVQGNTEEVKEMLLKQWQNQAEMYGIKIEDIELKIQKEKLDTEEEIKLIQQEIVKITAPHTQIQNPGNSYTNSTGKQHKILKEKDLVPYLNKGWELIKELEGDKYLVRK